MDIKRWICLVAVLAAGCAVEPKSAMQVQDDDDCAAGACETYEEDYECLNGGCDYYDEEWDEWDECQNGGCDWEQYDPHPPSEPVEPGEVLACKDTPACESECVIDLVAGESNCELDADSERVVIDMAEHDSVTVRATLSDPDGYAFHIGDSSSNNGHGGDGAEFSRDAELHLVGTKLLVIGSDHSLDQPGHIREFADLLPGAGGVLEFTLGDGSISLRIDEDASAPMCFVQHSHDLLRLDADDHEGSPDRRWYMGLNQVYSGSRTGSGLQRVELCFH